MKSLNLTLIAGASHYCVPVNNGHKGLAVKPKRIYHNYSVINAPYL